MRVAAARYAIEIDRPRSVVPHKLPGTNHSSEEYAKRHNIPLEAVRGADALLADLVAAAGTAVASSSIWRVPETLDEDAPARFTDGVRRVLILACGTSYHAGLVARGRVRLIRSLDELGRALSVLHAAENTAARRPSVTFASKITITRILMVPVFAVWAIAYGESVKSGMPKESLIESVINGSMPSLTTSEKQ